MSPEQRERAGEYVLGLLEGADRAAFEREMAGNAALRDAVDKLKMHLGKLDDTVTPLPADPALWQRIAARLDTPSDVSVSPKAANDNRWQRLSALAASVVVALGVGYLAGANLAQPQQPLMIAVLLTEGAAEPGVLVEAFADDSIRLVPLELAERPEDRVYQVWTLPDPEMGPVSMGIFDDPQTIRLSGPSLPPPESGQLYEITLEPQGGSPTGRPTGPILVKGFARAPL
jgi:anti-sigma-K factor RskA